MSKFDKTQPTKNPWDEYRFHPMILQVPVPAELTAEMLFEVYLTLAVKQTTLLHCLPYLTEADTTNAQRIFDALRTYKEAMRLLGIECPEELREF